MARRPAGKKAKGAESEDEEEAVASESEPEEEEEEEVEEEERPKRKAAAGRKNAGAAAAAARGGARAGGRKGKAAAAADEEEDEGDAMAVDENLDAESKASLRYYNTLVSALKRAKKDANKKLSEKGVEAHEVERGVAAAVRYILSWGHSHPGEPVSEKPIRAALGVIGKGVKTYATSIFQLAAFELATVFGLEMKELREGSSISFVPMSLLRPALRAPLMDNDRKSRAARGFTAALVGIIHREGGAGMMEDDLSRHVNRLGVDMESKTDPSLGDVKELMTKLQKQKYIRVVKDTDSNKLYYFCGEHAVELLGDIEGPDKGRELDEVFERGPE